MAAKFSVIVPVYNCAEFLPACADSILSQTEPDLELLLVDDGSTDGSAEICDQLAQRDSRIRVFRKPNGGASSARNYGLEHACGTFVVFIDGDDTIEQDLLETVSAVFSDSIQLVVFGMAFDYYNASGIRERTDRCSIRHGGSLTREELLSDFKEFFLDNALSSACNKVFSADIIRACSLRFSEQMTLYEDLDFVLRYMAHCREIRFLDRVLYHYRLSLSKPHISDRVLELNGLMLNLERLTDSVLSLGSSAVNQTSANLCAQLFDQHLMISPASRGDLKKTTAVMRECSALERLADAGAVPAPECSAFWPLIISERDDALWRLICKRRMVRSIKRRIKPVLKKLGLFH